MSLRQPRSSLSLILPWLLGAIFGLLILDTFLSLMTFETKAEELALGVETSSYWATSSWIRDYLYLPLTGAKFNERSVGGLEGATVDNKNNRALFVSWTIMGLWHGANWTFVLWGIYHSIIIFIYRKLAPKTKIYPEYIRKYFGLMITLPIMMLAWIPFLAASIKDTFSMWLVVIDPRAYSSLGMRETTYVIAFILLVGFFLVFWVNDRLAPIILKLNSRVLVSFEAVIFAVLLPLTIIYLRPISQFIYFQF
jgi:alginate O-acetyltransferase complex protein AlgI